MIKEGVTLQAIAESIGRGLGSRFMSLPPGAVAEHFGGLAFAVGANFSASVALTPERLG